MRLEMESFSRPYIMHSAFWHTIFFRQKDSVLLTVVVHSKIWNLLKFCLLFGFQSPTSPSLFGVTHQPKSHINPKEGTMWLIPPVPKMYLMDHSSTCALYTNSRDCLKFKRNCEQKTFYSVSIFITTSQSPDKWKKAQILHEQSLKGKTSYKGLLFT